MKHISLSSLSGSLESVFDFFKPHKRFHSTAPLVTAKSAASSSRLLSEIWMLVVYFMDTDAALFFSSLNAHRFESGRGWTESVK